MIFVFCSDPLNARNPDPAYETEVAAVEALGLAYALVSYEALIYDRDPSKAVRRVPERDGHELGIYRGWMLRPDQYKELYNALAARGVHLVNDPSAYLHCHYFPESYPLIERYTPESAWLNTGPYVPIDRIMELLRPFGSAPLVIKDFVKSRKHEWNEACFIPSASDHEAVERVVRRFVELQGEDLSEGIVFREFVEFEPLGEHPKSGMPLVKEFRIFFLDGEPMYSTEYWEEGDYGGSAPPSEHFQDVAKSVRSRFFTMDVAKRLQGDWMIVELGDAQVAGLPETANVTDFYRALIDQLRAHG
jgi:hypothetical protein